MLKMLFIQSFSQNCIMFHRKVKNDSWSSLELGPLTWLMLLDFWTCCLLAFAVNVLSVDPDVDITLQRPFTDSNILDNSYLLVKHFRISLSGSTQLLSLSKKLLIKGSNCVLPEREIREMFYKQVGIVSNISISVWNE